MLDEPVNELPIIGFGSENNGSGHPDQNTDGYTDDRSDSRDRFLRAIRSMEKPKPAKQHRPFHGITNDEIEERTIAVRQCIMIGFSPEQMVELLPCWGIILSRSQVYEYITRVMPTLTKRELRRFKMTENDQEPHDLWSRRTLLRCCRDAHDRGYKIGRDIHMDTPPMEGMRFRPDGWFWIERYHFYTECQLEPLPEVRWTQKGSRYIDLWERSDRFFKVLFFVREGNLVRIRQHFRSLLIRRGHPDLDLFRFTALASVKSSVRNFATDPVWQTCKPHGVPVSLVQFLRRSGDRPSRNASDSNLTSAL
jgi:hypothetical protein